ncbi:class II glutamine amidotransferase [Butyricicoccus sp. Marseille-Q5471]|uniref:class II glutamine amidotransferase n=1 Tax=Butyricicoccus sp. Marseille-Q5471 TaxID=3039493 RepID=UPI0024BCA905|nr:class II glutamine amidotransferase [Butyricicoccus sp. Marseille-Q5471]
MCSLFGLIDYKGVLNSRAKNHILNTLARICEARGTDATGIAYHSGGKLCIYKRPLPAHRVKFRVPPDVKVVMGHTRMTTQGNAKFTQNNHPFRGQLEHAQFALAHNGVLWNDRTLRITENLPQTSIETDSYIAVQLLEKYKALDFQSLKGMAEKVEGSFVFTVLDSEDTVWLVKGNNPLAIFCYDGFLLYASTEALLMQAEYRLRLYHISKIGAEEGEILRIDRKGEVTRGSFIPQNSYRHFWRQYPYGMPLWDEPELTGQDDLLDAAKAIGVSEADVQILLDYGCEPEEIEELLYEPELLRDILGTLRYSYI